MTDSLTIALSRMNEKSKQPRDAEFLRLSPDECKIVTDYVKMLERQRDEGFKHAKRAEAMEAERDRLRTLLNDRPSVASDLDALAMFLIVDAEEADHQSVRMNIRESAERVRAKAAAIRNALEAEAQS